MKKKKLTYYILIVAMTLLIVITSYNITAYIYNYFKHIKEMKRIEEEFVTDSSSDYLEIDLNELFKQNTDTVAYLKIEGTNISYPVVQSNDNDYYLDHDFNKDKNDEGAIFLDYRNDLDNLSRNNIIYGHGRLDKTMFGSLDELLKEEWYQNNKPYIKVTTKKTKMIFEIFSVYTIYKEGYYLTTYFTSDMYFENFLEELETRSIIDFKSTVNVTDKILTLSTCQNNFGKRIVVHAKLIKKEDV